MSKPIILDCDPGHDDAMAILLARGCPDIDLLAITTVAGNQTLEKTTLNARRVCTAARIDDVPIYAGCDRPLVRPQIIAADVHGESGLDGPVFGEPTVPVADEHAVDFLVRTLMASDGDITLVPVGPLTNIAMALRREPRIAERAAGVVLMGGAYTRGNRTPAAEFNILADPEAAAIVFAAGWPLTMVGLDLTHQAGATQAVIDEIGAIGTELSATVVELLEFFGSTYRKVEGFAAPPVHDPCAVARVARPGLLTVQDAFVAVETHGQWTAGMTVTDFDLRLGHPANAEVATHLDADGFWALMLDALRVLN
ncbi:MAG TPA: nucleoside hydrolase [Streptosporangiaceae bacterium]|nr:nucleoside hydrolase [Streptosporangiaceae bacterium]